MALNVKQIKTLVMFAKEQGAIKVRVSPDGEIELEFNPVAPDWIDDMGNDEDQNQKVTDDILYFSSQGS